MATDYGPRIRAARSYAGLSQGDLAEQLGHEVQWVKRRESGVKTPQGGDLLAIAAATKVPLEFLEEGFAGLENGEPGLAERVEALEARVQAALDLARTRDERVVTLELQMRAILGLSRGRIGADLAEAARQQALGEDREDVDDTDRPGRRPGDADR